MREVELKYLAEQMRLAGFENLFTPNLQKTLEKHPPKHTILTNVKFGNDRAVVMLNLKRTGQGNAYLFDSYQVTLKQENKPSIMDQTFAVEKGNNISLKDAYNLMCGRSVKKDIMNTDGNTYNTWIQMDFKKADAVGNYKLKESDQNHGYDLDSVLSKYPILELMDPKDRIRLSDSLQNGNRELVTFIDGVNRNKMFIEANPQFKSLNVYDVDLQRVYRLSKKDIHTVQQSLNNQASKQDLNNRNQEVKNTRRGQQKHTKRVHGL